MNTKTRYTIALFATAAAGGVLFAPCAAASPDTSGNTGQFLEQLSLTQATLPGKTPDEMVAAGYEACNSLRSGTTVLDEMSAVERTYHFNQGTLFVSAATTNLCPDFAG